MTTKLGYMEKWVCFCFATGFGRVAKTKHLWEAHQIPARTGENLRKVSRHGKGHQASQRKGQPL